MWVLKVEHVLEMTGRFRAHQSLKAEGLLEKWSPKMFTMFVSHQWLGHDHPDPFAVQLKVLQGVLSKLIRRELKIQSDVVSEYHGCTPTEAELCRIQRAYMWLDYFCVPQAIDGQSTLSIAEEQKLYVKKIPSYVDHCNVFVALVPTHTHSETASDCNFHSWLDRGWCRTELWCHFLSSTCSTVPLIVVKDHDFARFAAPLWHRYPVHLGNFTIDNDRALCSNVIRTVLTKHLAQLSQAKSKTAYRLLLSFFEEVSGLPRKRRSVEKFLVDFSFSKPLAEHHGLGPVACAALSGDAELVRSLVVAKASLQTHAPGTLIQPLPDLTPLHLAVWLRSHDLQVVQTLLALHADPNSSTVKIGPPLGLCHTVGAVDLLVQHSAGVNFQGKELARYLPIHFMAASGAPCQVLTRLLELRADVHGGRGGLSSASPLHNLAYGVDYRDVFTSAQLLLKSRADINQVCQPEGMMRSFELAARAYAHCGQTSNLIHAFRNISTTPLGWCAIFGNEDLLIILLSARADPLIRNNRGLRPIDIARSEKIRRVLQDPLPHIYSLEHSSGLIAECL